MSVPADAFTVTLAAPINIAFIKYWGKREGGEQLVLPTNDSFSITLDTAPFRSKTTVVLSPAIAADELWLNGEKVDVESNSRLVNVLAAVRGSCPADKAALKALMVSENNFPTAAGMASSASGYCALACSLVKVFDATVDVSMLARIGSGSACRSVYGGYVKWHMGAEADGSDCIAKQFQPAAFWPEMNVLCAVVKGQMKDISSTKGMQLSLQTAPMMAARIATVVNERMAAVSEAVQAKDFERFAEIAMTDSDDLQEICRTTTPIIKYATDDSFAVIKLVHAYNKAKGKRALAYTFDAGANAFMFTLDENLVEVVATILHHFPTTGAELCFANTELAAQAAAFPLDGKYKDLIDYEKKPLTFLLQTPVGSGPKVMDNAEALVDFATLKPIL
jgi:diphosphomevalonate decarboxylase